MLHVQPPLSAHNSCINTSHLRMIWPPCMPHVAARLHVLWHVITPPSRKLPMKLSHCFMRYNAPRLGASVPHSIITASSAREFLCLALVSCCALHSCALVPRARAPIVPCACAFMLPCTCEIRRTPLHALSHILCSYATVYACCYAPAHASDLPCFRSRHKHAHLAAKTWHKAPSQAKAVDHHDSRWWQLSFPLSYYYLYNYCKEKQFLWPICYVYYFRLDFISLNDNNFVYWKLNLY